MGAESRKAEQGNKSDLLWLPVCVGGQDTEGDTERDREEDRDRGRKTEGER